jgi:hypothetical protein
MACHGQTPPNHFLVLVYKGNIGYIVTQVCLISLSMRNPMFPHNPWSYFSATDQVVALLSAVLKVQVAMYGQLLTSIFTDLNSLSSDICVQQLIST